MGRADAIDRRRLRHGTWGADVTDAVAAVEHRATYRAVVVSLIRSVLWIAALTTLYMTLPTVTTAPGDIAVWTVAGTCVAVLVVTWQMRSIDRSSRPLARAIESISIIASLVAVVFATTYHALSHSDSGAFSEPLDRIAALYFTVSTLATVGYGDITARSQVARVVVTLQIVVNVAVLGAAVRLLIGTARRRGGQLKDAAAGGASSGSDDHPTE